MNANAVDHTLNESDFGFELGCPIEINCSLERVVQVNHQGVDKCDNLVDELEFRGSVCFYFKTIRIL